LQEIIQFFRSDSGYDRILHAMFDSFYKHGRAFGAIRLTRPSAEEESAISEFFKRDYYNQALIRIGLADFERQIMRNFSVDESEISLGAILSEYVGKKFEKSTGSDSQKPNTFASAILFEIIPKYENTPTETWLREITTQTRRAYRAYSEKYLSEPEAALNLIRETAEALNNIKTDGTLIPIAEFSEKFTGATDSFDFSGTHGILFLKALANRFDVPVPSYLEGRIELHLRAGLLSCAAVSSVTVRGLFAETDGQSDIVCDYYNNLNIAHVLTLENISKFTAVSAHGSKVFVVEDVQIFAKLCEILSEVKCTIICCAVGFSAAFVRLLKLVCGSNLSFFYAGNMDYKSLEIADKLYVEFGKNFIPWRYTHEDYAKIILPESTYLPDEKKNLAMHNDTLASLLSHMKKIGKTASSMPLVSLYAEDIRNSVQ